MFVKNVRVFPAYFALLRRPSPRVSTTSMGRVLARGGVRICRELAALSFVSWGSGQCVLPRLASQSPRRKIHCFMVLTLGGAEYIRHEIRCPVFNVGVDKRQSWPLERGENARIVVVVLLICADNTQVSFN